MVEFGRELCQLVKLFYKNIELRENFNARFELKKFLTSKKRFKNK